MTELYAIIEALKKPFRFAAKDGFAHLANVKGLEPLVDGLVAEAIALTTDKEYLMRLMLLRNLFLDFDARSIEDKKGPIEKGLVVLDSISAPRAPKTESEGKKPLPKVKKPKTKPAAQRAEKNPTQENLSKKDLTYVKGIGEKLAARLAKKGLRSVEDMLYYLPIRYEDRRNIKKIRELTVGEAGVTMGEVLASGEARYGRRKVFEVAISDSSGILIAKWFHFRGDYLKKQYAIGKKLLLYGTVGAFGGKKDMVHPDIEILDETDSAPVNRIVPIYSQIEKMHQKTIRKIVTNAVKTYASASTGAVPQAVLDEYAQPSLAEAILGAHAIELDPEAGVEVAKEARRSLVFDELFSLELSMAMKRQNLKREDGISFVELSEKGQKWTKSNEKLIKSLPYELTEAQKRVLSQIVEDMAAPHPMNRLLQGEVGSGKTIVSLIALLTAIDAGYQAAIMAPTELLAEQHFITMKKLCGGLDIEPTLLTGRLKKSERNKVIEAISSGSASIIIGTHSLIQKDIEFARLGLAVIDEQHRFGVLQRAYLKRMGAGGISPDILIMTATPIPRTLAMTVFGDMEVSIIDELPGGRSPITTKILREKDRKRAYELIRKEIASGGQAYIVYPLVEESEELPLKDATNMKEHLDHQVFPDLRLGLLHGRMKSVEKDAVMESFRTGEIDILVATTVVEVGVDVPNASLMLIEHAERFGLAQLHQLRGRVGRGSRPSTCLLLAQWTGSDDALERLRVMERTTDGFKIAEEDLQIRGPGDFLGARQSGLPDFRLSEALKDMDLLKLARTEAVKYLKSDPKLASEEAQRIVKVIEARWEGRLELAQVG